MKQSFQTGLYAMAGQYTTYRDALLETDNSHRKLYIALPEDVYNKHVLDLFIIKIRVKSQMGIIVFSSELRRIIKWER